MSDATQLLTDFRTGRRDALDELFPLVYQELHRLAEGLLRHERPDLRPNSTSLVHEAYLRLIDQNQAHPQDRAHFCAVAAQAMRRILVEHARQRKCQKRGGERDRVPLDSALIQIEEDTHADVDALDAALDRLALISARAAQVVELRYFAGLTLDESAAALGLSPRTVGREWEYARSWLFCELADGSTTRRETGHETPGAGTTGG